MEDEIVKVCESGLLPKLPFLLEEKDESSLQSFFSDTVFEDPVSGEQLEILSLAKKKDILENLLIKLKDDAGLEWWRKLTPKCRANIIIFLSENFDQSQLWSNSEVSLVVAKICYEITEKLDDDKESSTGTGVCAEEKALSVWFKQNHENCLSPKDSDFHKILQIIRVKYTKADWKYYPASVHGFGWILKQISKPQLADVIDMILPPTLLFSDDYYDDFKMLGLKMLSHIVHNVDTNDLIRNNWGNVIYDAVKRHCTDTDPGVIKLAMSILMKLLAMIEKDPSTIASQFTKYDSLLKQILFQMEFTSDLNQKKTWLPIIETYINAIGLATLHWSDKICDVLRDLTVCNDHNVWNEILNVTAALIRNTWVKADCHRICEIILRVVFNVSSFHSVCVNDEEKKIIMDNATYTLSLLEKCDDFSSVEKQLTEITEKGSSQNLHPDFIVSLKDILLKNV